MGIYYISSSFSWNETALKPFSRIHLGEATIFWWVILISYYFLFAFQFIGDMVCFDLFIISLSKIICVSQWWSKLGNMRCLHSRWRTNSNKQKGCCCKDFQPSWCCCWSTLVSFFSCYCFYFFIYNLVFHYTWLVCFLCTRFFCLFMYFLYLNFVHWNLENRYGIEQEYTLLQKDVHWPLGWPVGGYPGPQVMDVAFFLRL